MSEEKKNLEKNGLTDEQVEQVSGGVTLEELKEAAEEKAKDKFPTVNKSTRHVHR